MSKEMADRRDRKSSRQREHRKISQARYLGDANNLSAEEDERLGEK